VGDVTVHGSTIRSPAGDALDVGVGDAVERDGVRAVGLPAAGSRTALVLSAPGTGTVLWAPEPGPLPAPSLEALTGADLDVAILGVGTVVSAGTAGEAFARSLAVLRRASALTPECDVVGVGLDHTVPRERLARVLAGWGARLVPDGAPLGRTHAAPPPAPPRRTLALGAASSGKSALAESLLAAEPNVDYLPTGPEPDDEDWAARVALHRDRRPPWWQTLEGSGTGAGIAAALAASGPPLLLDSIGTWVSGALDRSGAWDDAPGWQQLFDAEVRAVVGAWRQAERRVVAVGEETGWGVVPETASGRRFRDALGAVNRRLAAESEQVLLVAAGRVVELSEGVPSV
jgi:adenosylcobinamide kinase/adenosylcobinamide-phosphate guanylyltransferase